MKYTAICVLIPALQDYTIILFCVSEGVFLCCLALIWLIVCRLCPARLGKDENTASKWLDLSCHRSRGYHLLIPSLEARLKAI